MYSEYIFREAMENIECRILLSVERINNTDETVILADSPEGLQELVNTITECS